MEAVRIRPPSARTVSAKDMLLDLSAPGQPKRVKAVSQVAVSDRAIRGRLSRASRNACVVTAARGHIPGDNGGTR